MPDEQNEALTEAQVSILDEELARLRQRVVVQLSSREPGALRSKDLVEAIETAFQSVAEPSLPGTGERKERKPYLGSSAIRVLIGGLTSFTGVCTILCIVFGVLGFLLANQSKFAGAQPSVDLSKNSASFIDLSKVFAGAIVGSSGAKAAAKFRSNTND